ncbi:MAG: serine/threonine protein kinase [Chroococcidiopsidaceae cyanobacterium CP_BM_ER_R8_30]|nr:serine/threonine protein kinase [Chroococcidiopsidaceae cyanobacterium CP_BM_ER_R8_30]
MHETGTPESIINLVEALKPLRLVRELGKGGMGSVIEAVESSGRHVAVKVFHQTVVSSMAEREDMFRDLQAAMLVNHPNLCRLLDFHRDERIAFLIMELVAGKPLRAMLKLAQHQPVPQGLKLTAEALYGTAALHAVGLVHGDVRPVNVIVVQESSAKLIDYGVWYPSMLCKTLNSRSSRTYTGYEAPEVWRGAQPNHKSDVYGLGVLAYHCLTGYKPRKSPEQKNVTHRKNSFCKSMPADVEELVLKALSWAPENRPASAVAMVEYFSGNSNEKSNESLFLKQEF